MLKAKDPVVLKARGKAAGEAATATGEVPKAAATVAVDADVPSGGEYLAPQLEYEQ